jgi:hypothetical protein
VANQLPGKKVKKGIGPKPEACLADGSNWLDHLLLPVFRLFSMFFNIEKLQFR